MSVSETETFFGNLFRIPFSRGRAPRQDDERLEASGILRTKRDPGEGRKLKEAVCRECAKIRQGASNEDQLAADEQSAEHVSLRSVAPGPVGMDDQQIA